MTPTPTPIPQVPDVSGPIVQALFNVNTIRGLAVLVVALVLARYSRRWVVRILTRGRVSINVATLLGNLAQVAIVVFGVAIALSSFGAEWTGLLTLVGAVGLAISLSMQDILKNVFAGIYLLLEQPFRIGDQITVKEATGKVQGIELRTTILWTDDHTQIVVPNNVILTEILTNRSASELQRQTIVISIKQTNLSDISQEIDLILKGFEHIASKPAPVTALEEVKDGVAQLRVHFWVRSVDRLAVTAQVVEGLQAHFAHSASVTIVG